MARPFNPHPIAALFPDLPPSDFAAEQFPELMASIQTIKEEAKDRRIRKSRRSASAAAGPELRSRDRNREAADLVGARLGVSGTTVKRVDRLAREAPELVCKVASGELSVKKALGQVAIETHADDAQGSRQVEALQVQRDIRQLERTIKATWGRCPIEHRAKILYALQAVLRELIEEQTATADARPAASGGQRPQTLRAS